MADRLGGIIFSEFLVDNPFDGIAGGHDTDGDGSAGKSEDFIEIQNASSSPISLDGFELWSTSGGQLYAFGPGDTIASGETATVVGEYTGTPPAGFYDAGGSASGNFLQDGQGGGDTVFLVDTATGDYVTFSYGSPPATPTPPAGFPGTNQIGGGEAIDSKAPNGVAFSRDGNGDWIESSPDPGTAGTVCIGSGALILTPSGERPVEELCAGDWVETHANQPKQILWRVSQKESIDPGFVDDRRYPVAVATPYHPQREWLYLSRQHGVLFSLNGKAEHRLVRAGHLASLKGGAVRVARGKHLVTYHNFLLAEHSIIFANGIAVETFLPGPQGIRTLRPADRKRLHASMKGVDISNMAKPVFPYLEKRELPSELRQVRVATCNLRIPEPI
ncbi:MAG: Hint domain-containing protein [Pseudomonadota bacterium]